MFDDAKSTSHCTFLCYNRAIGGGTMAQITFQNYHECYDYGKKVFDGTITKSVAVEEISANGMTATSAVYYINCVVAMLHGKRYIATVKQDAVTYFLTQIYSEFGKTGLQKALDSLKGHLQYQKGKNNLRSLQKAYEEFYEIIN